ncbi:hypothetical protein [Streptomyces sp. NPDC007905]|uniref:hypothetical protein n=1 Tax=Streptomyces sp. NPDC007905 TaxID=3364788 RepID=UPI0036F1320A
MTEELSRTSFYGSTSDERGRTMLAHYLHLAHTDDRYQDRDGAQRFTEAAPRWAAEIIRDVLVHGAEHAGGTQAVRRTVQELMELPAIEENSVEEDSITAALQETLPAAQLHQLSQIEASLAGHDALLQLLATHRGLHPTADRPHRPDSPPGPVLSCTGPHAHPPTCTPTPQGAAPSRTACGLLPGPHPRIPGEHGQGGQFDGLLRRAAVPCRPPSHREGQTR